MVEIPFLEIEGKPGQHPTFTVMEYLHDGVDYKHYKRASDHIQMELKSDVCVIEGIGIDVLITDQEKSAIRAYSESFKTQDGRPPIYSYCKVQWQNTSKQVGFPT